MKKGKLIGIEFAAVRDRTMQGFTVYEYLIKKLPDGETVGDACLRIGRVPPELGNVGYSVDEDHRRQGYATETLALICSEARALGLDGLSVTCREENTPSRRVCEKCGGTLSAENCENGLAVYKIKL
jgi:predicted acetyltransferase